MQYAQVGDAIRLGAVVPYSSESKIIRVLLLFSLGF